jgi:hypothetical protein
MFSSSVAGSAASATRRPVARVRVAAADATDHLKAVNSLIHRRYAWRGYACKSAQAPGSGRGVTLHASDDDGNVGTITVGLDGPTGLNTEGTFGPEVDAQRRVARRLCEFTRLAVESGRGGERVLSALFHGAYLFAHRQHACDIVLLEVNPRHVRYYERLLGAQVLGSERTNARVGAPAVLLGLAFAEVTRRLQAQVPHTDGRSLFTRGLLPDEEQALMSHLRRLHAPGALALAA